jgi:hypothetical protein
MPSKQLGCLKRTSNVSKDIQEDEVVHSVVGLLLFTSTISSQHHVSMSTFLTLANAAQQP